MTEATGNLMSKPTVASQAGLVGKSAAMPGCEDEPGKRFSSLAWPKAHPVDPEF